MNLRTPIITVAVCVLATFGIAGCSSEQRELDVAEGVPLHLGDLSYNVAITRFLNANDAEDADYLVGQPLPTKHQQYLGVFMTVTNNGSDPIAVGSPMEVVDTRGSSYEPVPSDSVYALDLSAEVPGDSQLPAADTSAASGPIKAAMVLFLVDTVVAEDRPVDLEIPGPSGETGSIELDL